jgi:hypothetical protein
MKLTIDAVSSDDTIRIKNEVSSMGLNGCRGHDHMVVGFTTTYAIIPISTDAMSLNLDQGKVYNIK